MHALSNGGIAHDLECPLTAPNYTIFSFCTAIHSVVTGAPRDFKFGTLTYRSKSHPADEKYSPKGAWSGSGEPWQCKLAVTPPLRYASSQGQIKAG